MTESGYRMLAAGEVLQEGDEYLDLSLWIWVPTRCVGLKMESKGKSDLRYRRLISENKHDERGAGK